MKDIDKKYIVKVHGKETVTYNGLRHMAHGAGLQSIRTEVLALPVEVNKYTTIVKATVTMKDKRVFENIGDANPENVSDMIKSHTTRMASTRAIARCFRDVLDIDMVSYEELADDIEFESTETKTTADPLGDPLAETIKDPFVKKGREDNVARKQKEKVDTDDFFGDTPTPVKSNDIDLDIPTDKFDDTILDEL